MKNIEETLKTLHVNELERLELCGTIDLMGTEHSVYTDGDEQYVSAKSLSNQFKLDWEDTKKELLEYDSCYLLGIAECHINPPEETLFIRHDRVQMFVLRLPFDEMKAKGHKDIADAVISALDEWSWVLNHYENTKPKHDDEPMHPSMTALLERDLNKCILRRKEAETEFEVQMYDQMIEKLSNDLNKPVSTFEN